MSVIWADGGIRKAFDQRAKMITENFSENTRYYLNRLNYIGVKVSGRVLLSSHSSVIAS
ncbi:hypothetical protein AHF37_12625 [Paragonimus kellicotti]|nr:hypothetical protein AHF37_12625 [Paragonimus kellicotti]